MAYVVGLIATDGCLVNTSRHVNFVSADQQLMETYLDCLGRPRQFRTEVTSTGEHVYRVTNGDIELYRWLMSIGLAQRKSLVLGAIDVPDQYLNHLLRGLLDGDGSIINEVTRADTKDRADYYWEYLQTKFVSASFAHVSWLRERIRVWLGIEGYIVTRRPDAGHKACYALRFGKRSSLQLLPRLYADPSAPRLIRKWQVWASYADRHGIDLRAQRLDKIVDQRPGGVMAASQV